MSYLIIGAGSAAVGGILVCKTSLEFTVGSRYLRTIFETLLLNIDIACYNPVHDRVSKRRPRGFLLLTRS